MLLTLDMFGAPLPSFNLKGKEKVRTYGGGCMSLSIIYVTFLYATLKLQHLLSKHNPSVNTFLVRDALSENEIWSGEDQDFQLALTIVNFATGEVKNDPKFVKWYGEFIDLSNGNKTLSEIPMHECTEKDFAKFHEPE